MTPTRGEVEHALTERLGSAHESRWMVEDVLGRHYPSSAPVDDAQRDLLEAMARRRGAGEPLQYVLGTWAFRHLELEVDSRALIPRPETEQVVEVALAALSDDAAPLVVDLGTGTGAIALACAVELAPTSPNLEVWATDADPDTLSLAERNRARLVAEHDGARRVRFALGRWFEALPAGLRGRVDLLVANPPYVSEVDWEHLEPEVRREPYGALVAGEGSDGTPGFADVEAIVRGAAEWLAPRGVMVIELSPPQADAAVALAQRLGHRDARIERDLAGRERMLVARR